MKAMILAAGFGTRLFPLTIDRTKPAIPFLGKPLVGYVAEYISKFGINEIIVNLHHQPDSVIRALGYGSDFGVNIAYSREEPEILGTAGALVQAAPMLGNEPFLVVNGKIITDIDISAAVETHRNSGALATMVLKENRKRERFTMVETEDGFVTGFAGMAAPLTEEEIRHSDEELFVPLMFTGIQIIERRALERVASLGFSDIVRDIYISALADGEKIAAHVSTGAWYELSTIQRYLDISLATMKKGSNVFAGEGCKLSAESVIRDSVIWDNVEVDGGTELYRTIIADGVKIPRGSRFKNAAIVRAEMVRNADEIPEKALKGYIEGENYIVPLI